MITASIYSHMVLGVENRVDGEVVLLVERFCFVEAGDYPVGGDNHTVFVEPFLIGRTPSLTVNSVDTSKRPNEVIPAGRIGRSQRFSATCQLSMSPGARREPIVNGLATLMAFRAACQPQLSGKLLRAASRGCSFLGA
jgi:hypothetical protein